MTAGQALLSLLEPYAPRLALPELVVEVNRLFHEFEAAHYDRRHPDVFAQGAPRWQAMLAAMKPSKSAVFRVLDFGCGTGFAAQQVLAGLPQGSVQQLTCYDLSPGMVAQCRAKVEPLFARGVFTDDLQVAREHGPYNVLATNGVLHHLADPLGAIRALLPCLAADAVWLAGHEPSSRFYRNPACLRHYEAYRRERQASRRRFGPPRIFAAAASIKKWWFGAPSPKKLTARAAAERGLFGRQPPAALIDRLVDLHVAHSRDEADSGRGFDYEAWQSALRGQWRLEWVASFGYMGPLYEASLPRRWQAACRALAEQFPYDGANFSTVWRRVATGAPA